MKASKATVYALSDPRTNVPFYIGCTKQRLSNRLIAHRGDAVTNKRHTAKSAKIRELDAIGLKPLIEPMETVDVGDWQEAERFWVEYLRFFGVKLLNANNGGGGSLTQGDAPKWTPDIDAQLGVIADAIIAEQMGITRKAVVYRRNVLKIPASYDLSRMKPPPPMGGWNARKFTDEQLAGLGTMPDYILAEQLGTNKYTIARHRRARGIKSYATQTGKTGQFADGHRPTRWENESFRTDMQCAETTRRIIERAQQKP